jgi:Rod binding domain-containing protein
LAINPPGDIILGVARAADPSKVRAAADKLARIDGSADAAVASGVTSARPLRPGGPATASVVQLARPVSEMAADRRPNQARGASDAASQFEAFVLQSFIQSMLPKHADSVFGRGTAGSVWKSMMAEMLAGELAQSGRVGVAQQIAESAGGRVRQALPADFARTAAALQSTLANLDLPPVGAKTAPGLVGNMTPTDRS